MQGVRAGFAGSPCTALPPWGRGDALFQSIMHKVGVAPGCCRFYGLWGAEASSVGSCSILDGIHVGRWKSWTAVRGVGVFSEKEEKSSELWRRLDPECVQRAEGRSDPNVPRISPTAETEEHLIQELKLCLWVFSG